DADATEMSAQAQAECLQMMERAKRVMTHPQVMAALATEDLSESYGRTICQWTDKLPGDCRPAADAILLSAAKAGMALRDLPGRAGQRVRALVHVSLADLMLLDGSSALMDEWITRVRAQWAAARAVASESGSDGGAWLGGPSLPLDVGVSADIPAAIRRAVI